MREDLKESSASEEGSDNEEKNVSRETSERLAVRECTINYATALAGVAEHYLASHGDAGTLAAADRYQVLFHINEMRPTSTTKSKETPAATSTAAGSWRRKSPHAWPALPL